MSKTKKGAVPRSTAGFAISGMTDSKKIKLAPYKRKGSVYDPIIDQIGKFTKAGQGFEVDLPKGVTMAAFQGRLATATRRRAPKLPKGLKYRKRATEGGKLAIIAYRG